ncbi:MAG: nuclear transport factor 2 family protein [Bacteroidota bacterium]|nr:nuclear transport factor 2 family protein [Bacteroidota bacterium]
MKHLMLFAALLLFGCAGTRAQTPARAMSTVEKEVEALERQRFAAQVSKDYAFLEKAFADDLIYTHASGKQNTKTEYLQSIHDGKSQYDKIDVEALTVRAYNDGKTAVVNGTILITLPPKDGQPNLAHLKYVVVQVKDKNKGWQVVLWQSQKQAS